MDFSSAQPTPGTPVPDNPSVEKKVPPQTTGVSPKVSQEFFVFVIILIVVNIATGLGVYTWQHKHVTDLQSLNRDLLSNKFSSGAAASVGQSSPITTESIQDEISQTLNILSLYKQQNGEYPTMSTTTMSQNLWRYGYNATVATTSFQCPLNKTLIGYSGYTNPTTNKVDQFNLYYCDGNSMHIKTQADIVQ